MNEHSKVITEVVEVARCEGIEMKVEIMRDHIKVLFIISEPDKFKEAYVRLNDDYEPVNVEVQKGDLIGMTEICWFDEETVVADRTNFRISEKYFSVFPAAELNTVYIEEFDVASFEQKIEPVKKSTELTDYAAAVISGYKGSFYDFTDVQVDNWYLY